MTISEVRKLVSKSDHYEWLKSLSWELKIENLNYHHSFTGFVSIYKFLEQQIDGWEKHKDDIPVEFVRSKNILSKFKTDLENFISQSERNKINEGQLINNWTNINRPFRNYPNLFLYNLPETLFLIEVYRTRQNNYPGAYKFIMGKSSNPSDKNEFVGGILAYEFEQQNPDILKRRNIERNSFYKLRKDLENQISESEIELNDHLLETNKKYDEYVKRIDDLHVDKDKQFTNWFEGTENEKGIKSIFNEFKNEKESIFNHWFEGSDEEKGAKEKINSLEETYKNLLALKEPANYWKKRAERMRTQGWISLGILIGLVSVTVWSLSELLWKTPDQIYTSFFEGDKSAAIRWSIIYVTFISFLAFCVRAITKVMFSSFHLARDADERNTLTYFYLSLINESDIDDDQRQLIIQSLFSRADSGLLKGDSGPTMPNDIASKIFGSN
ncbi:DUF6161 domain-containing protein [Aestuariibaculum marinum]|uniref:DUF6161 domain-containing protein n=1 Tax=Aestuariibaculum marinum TaxID=2683592 RepID=A0A8J6PX05_9FLAO|nr:DUF6161 domain-containing protein [Aestuariibaculum marinum]MBD0822660.1 hypothetical protein [Aestuariibaculum marinum]